MRVLHKLSGFFNTSPIPSIKANAHRSLVGIAVCLMLLLVTGCQLSLLDVEESTNSDNLQINASQNEPTLGQKKPDAASDESTTTIKFQLAPSLSKNAPTAAEIYEQISPAVAFVETPNWSGSGVWIEPGYLVSNAHVVWPYESVSRVVFANGEEHLDVPVIAWDLVADLAILGPLDTNVEPVTFANGSDLQIGNDIYLIGYPGEQESFPQPTLTQGVLSRIREWERIALSYFQVDAAIAGGQSGGVLVAGSGDVIGISTFSFTEAGFGLVASADDIVGRLDSLVNDESSKTIVNRKVTDGQSMKKELVLLSDDTDVREYILLPIDDEDVEVEISITGRGEPYLFITSLSSYEYIEADVSKATASATFEPERGVPYLVQLWQDTPVSGSYQFESTHPLVKARDTDDQKILKVGETYLGSIDHPDDFDIFQLSLNKGDVVEIEVDSLSIDPLLIVSQESALKLEIYEDDDGGGGIFGSNSKLILEASERGTYFIEVGNAFYGTEMGGYFLSVAPATDQARVSEPVEMRSFVPSRFGKLERYNSINGDFEILFPAEWQSSGECGGVTACFRSGAASLIILEEDLGEIGITDMELDEYVENMIENIGQSGVQVEIVSQERFTNTQNLVGEKHVFTMRGDRYKGIRLVYVKDGQYAFVAAMSSDSTYYDGLEELYEYMFDSFRVLDRTWTLDDAAKFFEDGQKALADEKHELAIEAYTQALTIDPYLLEAYMQRAAGYTVLGKKSEAISDYNMILAQKAGRHEARHMKGLLHYQIGEYNASIYEINRAIQARPYSADYYVTRALVHAAKNDLVLASKDITKSIKLSGNTTSSDILGARAYIAILQEDFEAAQADYDTLLADGVETAAAYIGAGIAYEALGNTEEAIVLLQQGVNLLSAEDIDSDPRLADLQKRSELILNKNDSQ